MARNKLAQLLLDNQSLQTDGGHSVSTFGIEQLTKLNSYLQLKIKEWDSSQPNYDPLFEIAKLGLSAKDENLQFKCHSRIAEHLYPTVRALEINAKQDNEIKITVTMADYARPAIDLKTADIEDIEIEDPDDDLVSLEEQAGYKEKEE